MSADVTLPEMIERLRERLPYEPLRCDDAAVMLVEVDRRIRALEPCKMRGADGPHVWKDGHCVACMVRK